MSLRTKRMLDLLARIHSGAPGRLPKIPFGEGEGYGVYEAPRGTLIHKVVLEADGRISSYKIIVPTMFNIPLIEKSTVGFLAKYVDLVPRFYDPCIPCKTHVIKIR